METYKTLIDTAFSNAEQNISKITSEIIQLEGFSGTKTRHFYNNLLVDGARYLEIGTWKGSSVCSAMYGNKATVVCIDNWSEFGGPKDEFLVNFENSKVKTTQRLLRMIATRWMFPYCQNSTFICMMEIIRMKAITKHYYIITIV